MNNHVKRLILQHTIQTEFRLETMLEMTIRAEFAKLCKN